MNAKETILAKLDELNIPYKVFNHEPIMTMEQGKDIEKQMGVPAVKTLLLVNHHKQFFMVLLPAEKKLNTKELAKQIGSGHLSFASADDIRRLLHAYPGAVSPLGLLFDEEKEIALFIDKELTQQHEVAMHPCENDCSLKINFQDFISVYLPALGVAYRQLIKSPQPMQPCALF